MNPKICLLVTTNYWPEPTGTAPYATDLSSAIKAAGEDVLVLTTYPHYPWWCVPHEYQAMRNPSLIDGVISVFRTRHYIPKRNNLITRVLYEISLMRNLKKLLKKVDLSQIDYVLTIGSSFSGHFIGKKFAQKRRIPLLMIIHDLIGKGLEQSGIPGGGFISKVVQILELSNLKNATAISVISPAMQTALIDMGVDPSRVTLIPLYGTNSISEVDISKAKLANGWNRNSFAVVHSGNMGNKQNLETLIDTAELLISETEISFYLVGHGNQEAHLKTLAKGLMNVHFLPSVADEDFPNLLGGADLLLVSERASQLEMSLPSKLTSYFFSNRPVVASVPIAGATARYLDGIAQIVPAENPESLAKAILFLKECEDFRKSLAEKALIFARQNLTRENGRKRYIDWLSEKSNIDF